MGNVWYAVKQYVKHADMLLLFFCCAATCFGIAAISSATNYLESERYVTIQVVALIIGIVFYILFSLIDIELIAEKWEILLAFNVLFIASLYFFGVQGDTGNKSWLRPSFLPFGLQPAEICKISFILIMAWHMNLRRDKLNSAISIGQYVLHLALTMGLILFVSEDAGMALVYAFIFIFMALAAGVRFGWFAAGAAAIVAAWPVIWNSSLMREDQKNRILVVFNASIDPLAQKERYQLAQSQRALGSGGLLGQGYYNGAMTQRGYIPAQHTDFIFASIGEEWGILGCLLVMILLSAIVIRCIYIGVKSNNYMNRLICLGIAGMLIFQIFVNIGMCIGLVPVIGLTLPFFSYGGSSIVTMFAAMGIISGIKMRPTLDKPIKYIRPPLYSYN